MQERIEIVRTSFIPMTPTAIIQFEPESIRA